MADIKLAKTVSGEIIIGINDEDNKRIKDVAVVQIMPSPSGNLSIALLPYGFPFEDEISGFISKEHLIYEIKTIPEELINKYTEAKSNIKIAQNVPDGKIIL